MSYSKKKSSRKSIRSRKRIKVHRGGDNMARARRGMNSYWQAFKGSAKTLGGRNAQFIAIINALSRPEWRELKYNMITQAGASHTDDKFAGLNVDNQPFDADARPARPDEMQNFSDAKVALASPEAPLPPPTAPPMPTTLNVKLPAGVKGGQTIRVKAPGGRMVEFTVPPTIRFSLKPQTITVQIPDD